MNENDEIKFLKIQNTELIKKLRELEIKFDKLESKVTTNRNYIQMIRK